RAAAAREGRVDLAKLDVDRNPAISQAFRVQGIPAVKAFRDGQVASEFTGAIPPAEVERFFDALVPSEAELEAAAAVESGDDDARDAIRRVMIAIFTELGPDNELAREHRRRLSAVLY